MPNASIARSVKATLAAVLLCLVSCFALAGCSQQFLPESAAEEEEGPTSRTFMAQMNDASEQLQEKMATFTDAVAREDLVSMRVSIDATQGTIDEMSGLEAPEELKELQQKYVDGCTQLKDVLQGYLDLYSEIEASTVRNPFDYDGYPERLAQLQASYDEAVQALQDADESASQM